MALALFDLDDTLLDGDSATLWFDYLINSGIAPKSMQAAEHQMMQLYYRGELAMEEYMNFTLQPLVGRKVEEVNSWMEVVLRHDIVPRLFPQGQARLDWHRQRGDRIVLISASGEHIVKPIAKYMGIDDVIAINLAQVEGCYTGKTEGVLSYQAGKVIRLQEWLSNNPHSLDDSYGYSDSINDVPLLNTVANSWAINPGDKLSAIAVKQGWEIVKWVR
jgi:HAD superfamily hydrolase (TIGR01490 family)